MIRVRFNSVDEFLQEMGCNAGATDDGVVRVTQSFRGGGIREVTVLATFVRGDRIVRFEAYVGTAAHGMDAMNDDTEQRAKALMASIEARAKELGLAVRPGVYEPEPEGGGR